MWVCGFCFFAARLAGKLYAVHKFNRSSVPVAVGSRPDILAKELCASAEYKRKRPLDLRISSRAFGAYQSGLFSASIILPKNIDDFSDSEINFMLRHELCHFRSGDLIILLILRLLECVLWWNPTVFLLRKSVERMLELRCDRRVCESMTGSERADYMETLLKLARGSVSKEEQAVMRFQGRQGASELEQRITILTDTKKGPAASRGLLAFVMVGFVLLFTASYFVIVIPWGTPPPEDMEYVLDVNPETSYIVHTDSGEYILYYDGTVLEANLPEDILKMDPYRNLVIYEGENPEP